jgi:Domain of unknown function (DUF4148)
VLRFALLCQFDFSHFHFQPKEITMNSKTFITTITAAVALFSAASSFAAGPVGEVEEQLPVATSSTVTRAEVRAAAVQARALGASSVGDHIEQMQPKFMSTLTREQVRAETLEAIRLHAIGHGEHNYFPTQAQLDSIRMAGERAVAMKVASL